MSKKEEDEVDQEEGVVGTGGEEDSGSSDDGSGSGADSDEEEELILLLQARLQTCGGRDYDAHVQLIKCLRDRGEIRKLEKARQAFASMFPLTEDMWLEWISDESRLAVTDDDQAKIIGLFERGVADYCTPKLWEHYMGHCQKRFKEREEVDPVKPKLLSEARAVADRALTTLGSHFSEGQRLWELQRAFELENLEGLQQDNDSAAVIAQRVRVRACFVNHILTPGRGVARAMEAYRAWEQDPVAADGLEFSVEKHSEHDHERETYELAITASAHDLTALIAAWIAYVEYEEKQISRSTSETATILQRTPSVHATRQRERTRCIFERAVLQCCLYPAIWQAYLTWELEGNEPSKALDVYKRAVRNCPFSAELWVAYALYVEETADFSHAGGDQEEARVDKVYLDAAAHVGYYSPGTLRLVSLSRCDCLRRRFQCVCVWVGVGVGVGVGVDVGVGVGVGVDVGVWV
jgi:squamous cell carcinoma antigen recognized by T-cells 3